MPARTPAEARAAINQQPFPNYAQEQAARAEMERQMTELTAPISRGASERLAEIDVEAAKLADRATELLEAQSDLQERMQRRQLTAKEARKERDRLVREEMRLSQMLDAFEESYARELYTRDHPEDVLNVLYERYPSLERPFFPI